MKIFFDGLDIRMANFDFINETEIDSFQIKREKPFLNYSRYCLPYPILSFFNFVFYPKKFIEKNSIDLIYAFKIFPLNKIPWIADVECFHYLNAFYSYFGKENFFNKKINYLGQKIVRKSMNSSYCKKIVPWSNYAKKTVGFFGGKNLEKKTTVVYPGIKSRKKKKRKEKEKISLLFVATNPVYKGTDFVFSAFSKLKEKYDVELNCFGNFSEKTKKNFPEVNFGFVSKKEFDENVILQNDILLMPSLMESFGFTVLDAFSNSVPVVSSDVMALPEINKENKTGFLIKFPKWYHEKLFLNPYYFFNESSKLNKKEIIFQLIQKTSVLIEDSSLRHRFGRNAFKEVEKGKFSFKKRKRSMKELLENAI